MCSSKGKSEQDHLYDDFYHEMCVFMGCALGTLYVAENRLDKLFDDMKNGVMWEYDRVMSLFGEIGKQ